MNNQQRSDGEPSEMVAVSDLRHGDSPRRNGEDAEHVRILAEMESLPPILVHRASMRVIDGMHRLRAAVLAGHDDVAVKFFDGDEHEAFVAAVKANVTHGLPLSLADRRAATSRILATYPHWSDRMIASVVGLSPNTVAAVRKRTGDAGTAPARLGRDGRIRSLDSAKRKRRVHEIMQLNPAASLREIARTAGVSASTVHAIRKSPASPHEFTGTTGKRDTANCTVQSALALERASASEESLEPATADRPSTGIPVTSDHRHDEIRRRARSKTSSDHLAERQAVVRELNQDPSLRYNDAGRSFLRWLASRSPGADGWTDFAEVIPVHCSYRLADLARDCATEWSNFADYLERLPQRGSQAG